MLFRSLLVGEILSDTRAVTLDAGDSPGLALGSRVGVGDDFESELSTIRHLGRLRVNRQGDDVFRCLNGSRFHFLLFGGGMSTAWQPSKKHALYWHKWV